MSQPANDTNARPAADHGIPVNEGAANQLGGAVQAVVLDIDGTFKDTFNIWYERSIAAVDSYAQSRADARGIPFEEMKAQVMEELPLISPFDQFTNIDVLSQRMECLQPREGEDFEAIDARIAHDYIRHRDEHIRAFPGTAETLDAIHAQGALIFINTDAKRSDVEHTLFRMGLDPDLFEEIHCRGDNDYDKAGAAKPMDTAEARHRERLDKKIVTGGGKPNPELMDQLAERYHLNKDQMLFVGDNASDAKSSEPNGVPLAWQKQGADTSPEATAYQNHMAKFDHYRIGLEATQEKMEEAGVWPPSYTLEGGFPDLQKFRYEDVRAFDPNAGLAQTASADSAPVRAPAPR